MSSYDYTNQPPQGIPQNTPADTPIKKTVTGKIKGTIKEVGKTARNVLSKAASAVNLPDKSQKNDSEPQATTNSAKILQGEKVSPGNVKLPVKSKPTNNVTKAQLDSAQKSVGRTDAEWRAGRAGVKMQPLTIKPSLTSMIFSEKVEKTIEQIKVMQKTNRFKLRKEDNYDKTVKPTLERLAQELKEGTVSEDDAISQISKTINEYLDSTKNSSKTFELQSLIFQLKSTKSEIAKLKEQLSKELQSKEPKEIAKTFFTVNPKQPNSDFETRVAASFILDPKIKTDVKEKLHQAMDLIDSAQLDQVAKAMIGSTGKDAKVLIKDRIAHMVQNLQNERIVKGASAYTQEGSFLRGESIDIKLISSFLKRELSKTVLESLKKSQKSLNDYAEKMAVVNKEKDGSNVNDFFLLPKIANSAKAIQENAKSTQDAIESFLTSLNSRVKIDKNNLKDVLEVTHYFHEQTGKLFSDLKIADKQLATLLMLRFIIPSLITPQGFLGPEATFFDGHNKTTGMKIWMEKSLNNR